MVGEHTKNAMNFLGISMGLSGYIYIGFKENWLSIIITGVIALILFLILIIFEIIKLSYVLKKELQLKKEKNAREYINKILNT